MRKGYAIPPQRPWPDRRKARVPVRRADGIHDSPLFVEHRVRAPKRIAKIVDIRRFRCRSVELDDFESYAVAQFGISFIPNIEAADIEAGQLLTDFVDHPHELARIEVAAIFENAALAMIASLDE